MSNDQALGAVGANLNQTSFSSAQVFIPDSLKFKQIKQGLRARRVPVKIRAEQQSYSSNGNKLVRLMMPNNELYDTRKGYFTFNVAGTVTGGTYARFAQGIHSILNRVRILFGSTEVEDIREYNQIASILYEMKQPAQVTANIGAAMGFDTQANRETAYATKDYKIGCMSGVLGTELLPLDNINAGMIIEMYLEDPMACVETDGANPQYTLSNLEFHCERLVLDQAYRNYIRDTVRSQGLQLGFHSWAHYQTNMGTGSRQQLQINHRSGSVNGILHTFRDSSVYTDPQVDNKFLFWDPLTIQDTQVKVNNSIFPDEPIDCVYATRAEPYQGYLRWTNHWDLDSINAFAPPISNQAFATNRFILIDDFEPYPEVDDIINPMSTEMNNSTILKMLNFTGAIGSGYQLDSWVEYFTQIGINSNGTIQVLQ